MIGVATGLVGGGFGNGGAGTGGEFGADEGFGSNF
jgi:hypothetical protein